ISRPVDGEIPDRIRPPAAAPPRQPGAGQFRARHTRASVPCRDLGRSALGQASLRAAPPAPPVDLRPGRLAFGRPDDVDRLPGGIDHVVSEPGRRRLQHRRADETPDERMNTDKPNPLARSLATLLIAVAVGTAAGHVLTVERVYEPSLSRSAGEDSS